MRKIIYIVIIFIFVFCCIELSCRLLGIGKILYINNDSQIYQYDQKLGWFLTPNLNKNFGTMGFIKTNSMGFRDVEHDYFNKTKERIMFIGDSFTFGDKINQNNIFVELLRDKLAKYELFNCGVSGYGTTQEYLLLLKYLDVVSPDIVFFIISFNDPADNIGNYVSQGYYRPLIMREGKKVFLYNETVPKSYHCYKNNFFIKNSNFFTFLLQKFIMLKNTQVCTNDYEIIETILTLIKQTLYEKNIIFYIGLTHNDSTLEEFCKNNNIKYVVLENSNTIENDVHWNEKGHQFVAENIYNFLKNENKIE